MTSTKPKIEGKVAPKTVSAPVVKASTEPKKPELVIVPAGGIEKALNPDPIPEEDKKRALELLRYATKNPNHGIIRNRLAVLDQRAVAWAIEEYERQGETTLYHIAKTSQYDLQVLGVVTAKAPEIPVAAIPPAAAALTKKHS